MPGAEEPIGQAPTLSESLEASLRALFMPERVFRGLQFSPPPGLAQMLAQVLFWTALGSVLTGVIVLMNQPTAAVGLAPMAIGLAAVLVLAVPVVFVAAGVLHGLALFSGGREGFAKSFQLLSLAASLAPVAAVAVWAPFPMAGLLPTVYLTYVLVRGVELLHHAPSAQAWMVVGVFGGLMTVGQAVFYRQVKSVQYSLENMAGIYSVNPRGAASAGAPAPSLPATPEEAMAQAQQAMEQAQQVMVQAQSALDMVSPPSASGAAGLPSMGMPAPGSVRGGAMASGGMPFPGAGPSGAAAGAPSPDQMQQMGMNLLDMANKQIAANPDALSGFPPEQRAQIMNLLKMANQVGAQVSAGGKADSSQVRRQQAQMQQFMQQVMQGAGQREGYTHFEDEPAVGSGQVTLQQQPKLQQPRRSRAGRKRRPASPPPEDAPLAYE